MQLFTIINIMYTFDNDEIMKTKSAKLWFCHKINLKIL